MTWADRISRRLSELGWTQAELARRSGVPYTTIRKYLGGDGSAVKQPKRDKLKLIAQALGATPEWILFGAGSSRIDLIERRLPVWPLSELGSAMDIHASERRPDREMPTMAAPPGAQEDDLWIEVDDHSMEPEIPAGTRVLLSSSSPVQPGDLVVAHDLQQNTYLLRRYRIVSIADGARTIGLAALNENFGEIITKEPGNFRVLGRITHKLVTL